MSEASDSARVRLLIADYGVASERGKVTIVGGGIAVLGQVPNSVSTAPFAILATADFDPKYIGQRPHVELSLEQENGQLVSIPGLTGPLGQQQHLHAAMNDELKPVSVEGLQVPRDAVRPRVQILLMFQAGLPLERGHNYRFRLTIDDESRDEWTESFYVPEPLGGDGKRPPGKSPVAAID